MNPVLTTLIPCILGMVCSRIARKRNRHPFGWFVLGAFFGIFGLVLLYVLPPKKVKQVTEPIQTEPVKVEEEALPEPATLWYYLDEDNNQFGPMSFDLIEDAWEEQRIGEKTYLWNESMEDWKTLESIPEVRKKLMEPELAE